MAAAPAPPDYHDLAAAPQRSGQATAKGPSRHAGFEDVANHLLETPFAWFLMAHPITAEEGYDFFQEVQSAARGLSNAGKQPGEQALELKMAVSLLTHLYRGRFLGLWNVRWFVGASSDDTVVELAELLAATAALQDHPLLPVPGSRHGSLEDVLNHSEDGGAWRTPHFPFITTSEHLAVLGRTPSRELPGFRMTLPQSFDTQPEADFGDGGAPSDTSIVRLGDVLDELRRPSGSFDVSFAALNRHMFVCGATGSGKSQTVKTLLDELSRREKRWLVIEPAKAEYRRMSDRVQELREPVHVIRLGHGAHPPCMLNPLEPEPGFNLQTHIDMVAALFLASFEADEPFPQVLAESLRRCYEDLGWDLATGRFQPFARLDAEAPRPTYPTLSELQRTADEVVRGIGYGTEVQSNVRGFIKVRLNSLRLGTPGRFFESGHPLDVGKLLGSNVVIELEDVGSDQDKAFVIGAILTRLVEHLRMNRVDTDTLQHVTVIEEAHRLLRRPDRTGPASHAVEMFAALLAEVRAYGEGLVIAEQIPTKIVSDVVKNTAVQIMHRLPAKDDRELIGAAMNMSSDQMGYVVGVERGEAAAFSEGMDRPLLVRMTFGQSREGVGDSARDPGDLLLGRRGVTCSALCRERPCTLIEMSDGASCVERIPGFGLYVELAILNLISPTPFAPEPTDALFEAVRGSSGDPRRIACGIGHFVDSSVARRRSYLSEYCDPSELAATMMELAQHVFHWDGAAVPRTTRWEDSLARFRVPSRLEVRVRLGAYLGVSSAPDAGEVGRSDPLAALRALVSQGFSDTEARVHELLRRIEDVLARQDAPPGTAGGTWGLAQLLGGCFGWYLDPDERAGSAPASTSS
jgi:DNA helicase HerA-like ATPase